jgi:hypothetical protein
VEFELVDYLLDLVVDVLELAVPQFCHLRFLCCLVGHFQHVRYLPVDSSLVSDYLWLEVHLEEMG